MYKKVWFNITRRTWWGQN